MASARYTLSPMLLLSAILAPVHAAPTGDPVPLSNEGFVVAGIRLTSETLWEQDADCEAPELESSNCEGAWKRGGYVATGRLVLADGLALDGEVGWHNDILRQADFSGSGLTYAAGLRGALPLGSSGWWFSGVGRYERGENRKEQTDEYLKSTYQLGTITGMLAWRDDNISTWIGGQGMWMWDHTIERSTARDDTDPLYALRLRAGLPASGVFGLEVISPPLGPGWTRDWRMSIGFEGSLGQSQAAHFWAAVRY